MKLPHACKNKMTDDHVVYCSSMSTWSFDHF
nr:MAG TPA: small hydrophobic protein [Caudoviricetes sp.]